jgi:hypothetical protein
MILNNRSHCVFQWVPANCCGSPLSEFASLNGEVFGGWGGGVVGASRDRIPLAGIINVFSDAPKVLCL